MHLATRRLHDYLTSRYTSSRLKCDTHSVQIILSLQLRCPAECATWELRDFEVGRFHNSTWLHSTGDWRDRSFSSHLESRFLTDQLVQIVGCILEMDGHGSTLVGRQASKVNWKTSGIQQVHVLTIEGGLAIWTKSIDRTQLVYQNRSLDTNQ